MRDTPHALSTADHSRDSAGLTYVYPVLSRRAGGVSVGINLNINNACNWGCVYCQVPNLTRGGPPPVDLDRLERELDGFFQDAVHGNYLQQAAPPEFRKLVDVAFSGNGEPTSAAEFAPALARVHAVMARFGLGESLPMRLITNGSLVHKAEVQEGLAWLGQHRGEVWFKVDQATEEGAARINATRQNPRHTLDNLRCCAALAPTWVQTCAFAWDGRPTLADGELEAYLALLTQVKDLIRGVLLYGIARPPQQSAQLAHLERLAPKQMELIAQAIKKLGIPVRVTP